tara:strand:- start:152 stop:610 length:459 start_codon:yes stop_codon:yes gene_type:complete
MYLPLTGYKEKDSNEVKMSINSIGPRLDPQIVQALDKSAKPQDEAQSIQPVKTTRQEESQGLSEEQKKVAVDGFYSNGSMSTQDFMSLHAQAKEEPFEVLDKVIAKLKENVEAAGDAMEAISEMTKKTSKENLALQVLQKTLEAMDETSGDR